MWRIIFIVFISVHVIKARVQMSEAEVMMNEDSEFRQEWQNTTQSCFSQFRSTNMMQVTIALVTSVGVQNPDAFKPAKCFISCVLEKFGVYKQTRGGELNKAKLREKAEQMNPEAKPGFLKGLMACFDYTKQQQSQDACQKAYIFVKCILDFVKVIRNPAPRQGEVDTTPPK